jgi:hypothetical protein
MMPSQLIWERGRLTFSETPFLTGLDGTVKFGISPLMTGRVATKMDWRGIQRGLVYVEWHYGGISYHLEGGAS